MINKDGVFLSYPYLARRGFPYPGVPKSALLDYFVKTMLYDKYSLLSQNDPQRAVYEILLASDPSK